MSTIADVLAGLIAAAIIVVGARFLIAPKVAAAGYGVPAERGQPSGDAYLAAKGVRDIASGLMVIALLVSGATRPLAWMLLAASVIPVSDAWIVLRSGGSRSVALGVHGITAVVMLVTVALLVV
ncbi:DUF4267 domain-containing protein [Mycobacterium sp. MYCO198283]|uniref:DUF4267 domain-containing protein n=1 Tax=Mycobacterium sp. MYCO198283 TaxID=2883505 RepID=UPI001E30B901|nr:DUF4267 domain-containing protein [Mycobacterium sp. MYCO198283]MCG5434297.1 DUF4267 domain-containing protein [Mycobacterium sp. MYCO198283]